LLTAVDDVRAGVLLQEAENLGRAIDAMPGRDEFVWNLREVRERFGPKSLGTVPEARAA
jgi:hypothetical protein